MDIILLSTSGVLLGLGIALSFMDIPFGKGLLNFVAFALIAGISKNIVMFTTSLYPESYVFGGVELCVWVYYTILGIGAVANAISLYRQGASAMVQGITAYTSGLLIDYAVIQSFVENLGDALRTLFLYDILSQLIYSIGKNTVTVVIATVATSIIEIIGATAVLSIAVGLSIAFATTSAVSTFITRLADMFHAYISRLVSGFISLIAGLREGNLMIILTIALAIPMTKLVVSVYAMTYSIVIALWIWNAILAALLYILRLVTDALTTILGGAAGSAIGSRLASRIAKALRAVGGRPYREAQAAIFGNIATLIGYVIGGLGLHPLIVAVVVVMCLANTVVAARLLIGVPRRFLSRYIAALYTLTLYSVAFKTITSWLAPAILEIVRQTNSIFKFTIPLLNIEVDLTWIKEHTPIGGILNWLESMGTTLDQLARDP